MGWNTSPPREFETVYFMAAIDNDDSYVIHGIKVGIAADPMARLKGIQSSNPYRIEMFGSFDAVIGTEAKILARLAMYQIRGEWFRPDPVVLEIIEEYLGDSAYLEDVVPAEPS